MPVEDRILFMPSFAKFLNDSIKINKKAGLVGTSDKIKITVDGAKVIVTATLPFSKRYLKVILEKVFGLSACFCSLVPNTYGFD